MLVPMPAQWDPSLLTGNPVVDKQHQRLFALVAQVHGMVAAGEGRAAVAAALGELARYTHEHFQAEEELMLSSRFPGRPEHRRHHFRLLERANALVAEHRSGRHADPSEIAAFLAAWLEHHIRGDDRALIDWLREGRRADPQPAAALPGADCR